MKEQNEELLQKVNEAGAIVEAEKRRIKTTTINSLSVIEEVSPTYKTNLDPQILEQQVIKAEMQLKETQQ